MALGTTVLSPLSTLYPPTFTPLTSSTCSLNSEGSSTSISRNSTGTSFGMWLYSLCSSSLLAGRFYEPLGLLVYLYALLTKLERAPHPGSQRDDDYGSDEEGGDFDAVGALEYV